MKVNIQYMELWLDRYAEFTHQLTTDLEWYTRQTSKLELLAITEERNNAFMYL